MSANELSHLRQACRFCGAPLTHSVVDLGAQPPCNSIVSLERFNAAEAIYPLHAMVCSECLLVQLNTDIAPDSIYTEYSYFSSFSDSWLDHARRHVEMMTQRLQLDGSKQVVELASNDGYLLQYFIQKGIPAYGIDPAANVAPGASVSVSSSRDPNQNGGGNDRRVMKGEIWRYWTSVPDQTQI